MPSLQDLEQFRASFRSVGDEISTLASRGESFNDFDLPEQDASPQRELDDGEIASLLSNLDDAENPEPYEESGSEADAEVEPEASPDADEIGFGDFLDTIPDDLSAPPQESDAPVQEPSVPPDDFSIPDFGMDEEAAPEEVVPSEDEPGGLEGLDDLEGFELPEDLGPAEDTGPGFDLEADAEEIPQDTSAEQEEGIQEEGIQEDAAFPEDLDIPPDLLSGLAEGIEEDRSTEEDQNIEEVQEADDAGIDGEPAESDFSDLADLADLSDAESLFAEEAPPAAEETSMESTPEEMPEDLGTAGSDEPEEFDFSIPEFEGMPPVQAQNNETPAAGSSSDLDQDEAGGELDTFASASEEGTPMDAFDTFSLDPSSLGADFGLSTDEAGSSDSEMGELEEFSLAGIDDVFSSASGESPGAAAIKGLSSKAAAEVEVEEIQLNDEDLKKLEETLADYPLNLRIACEELIAEHAVAPDLMSSLVKLLVRGAPAKETASLASRIMGRPIVIPKGFEKRSGADLEAEQASFAYAFVHRFLPILGIFSFIAAVAASLVYLGVEFIYTPIRAEGIYEQGYERILDGDYARANERFSEAFALWRKKKWFYAYAEGFRDERQYIHAQEKYEQLLRFYPRDKQGALDYAQLESEYLRNYEKADRIIRNEILDFDVDDREGLLALGQINLDWGELEQERYEMARESYARLIEKYGRKDEFLEGMLKYFIRTDNLGEVLPLQAHFMYSERRKISTPALAELGGYLLDKKLEEVRGVPDEHLGAIEGLRDLLTRAVQQDPSYPESYYHLSRYYQRFGSIGEERRALENALRTFEQAPELSAKRTGYRLDTHRRYAQVLIRGREFISAEEQLMEGIGLYEDAVRRRILSRSADYGVLYADMGDIEYFVNGDMETALDYYDEAKKNAYASPEMNYRMGSAQYALQNWREAVDLFFEASTELPLNRRLLFSLGNASYMRGNLFTAQGYYNRLLDMLEAERARFPMLLPNERPEHMELAERIMRARNNLGVALEALADRTGDTALRSRALALYSESARAWDSLTRDPDSMVRSASANLAYLNTRNSLYPEAGYEQQLYMEIDKDVLEPSEWEQLLTR